MNNNINPFDKFKNNWALVTAGNKDKFNSMTISWGSFGYIYNKNIITIYVREGRYTFKFLKDNDIFTISFYEDKYKDKLKVFGTLSGKDVDKVKETSFNPIYLDDGITYKESKETYILKKIYMDKIDIDKLDSSLSCYYDGDTNHYIIMGEVVGYINK